MYGNKNEHDREWLRDSKMEACLEKMNVLAEDKLEIKVDISEIIREGELIRAAKERREEGITFTIAAGLVVCSLAFWSYVLGPKFILYGQLLLLGISALAGIPLVKYLNNREGSI